MTPDRLRELAIHVEELIFDGDTDCGTRLRWTLERAFAERRAAALEEAARLCETDAQANDREVGGATNSAMVAKWHNRCLAMEHCADRIRSLITQGRDEVAPSPSRVSPEKEKVMPNTKQGTDLPAGQMRMTIQLTIEGPLEEAGQKLAAILKLLPRETQAEALKQIETRLNEARAKEA